jgi:hypothetical protein
VVSGEESERPACAADRVKKFSPKGMKKRQKQFKPQGRQAGTADCESAPENRGRQRAGAVRSRERDQTHIAHLGTPQLARTTSSNQHRACNAQRAQRTTTCK